MSSIPIRKKKNVEVNSESPKLGKGEKIVPHSRVKYFEQRGYEVISENEVYVLLKPLPLPQFFAVNMQYNKIDKKRFFFLLKKVITYQPEKFLIPLQVRYVLDILEMPLSSEMMRVFEEEHVPICQWNTEILAIIG